MSGWIIRPHTPLQIAVARALRTVAAPEATGPAGRIATAQAVLAARTAIRRCRSVAVAALIVTCAVFVYDGRYQR